MGNQKHQTSFQQKKQIHKKMEGKTCCKVTDAKCTCGDKCNCNPCTNPPECCKGCCIPKSCCCGDKCSCKPCSNPPACCKDNCCGVEKGKCSCGDDCKCNPCSNPPDCCQKPKCC